MNLNFHKIVSEKITYLLDNCYYNYLKKLYNNTLENIFKYPKIQIIKPEYFVFFQYYSVYKTMINIREDNLIPFSLWLHMIYISGMIFENLTIKYNYTPVNNANYLKNTCYLLFKYLFFLKIIFLKIFLYKKIIILSTFITFYFLHNVNYIYKKRLEDINNKKDLHFAHPLKILIISPNKDFIENVVKKTDYFTYGNLFLLINILYFLFI